MKRREMPERAATSLNWRTGVSTVNTSTDRPIRTPSRRCGSVICRIAAIICG